MRNIISKTNARAQNKSLEKYANLDNQSQEILKIQVARHLEQLNTM